MRLKVPTFIFAALGFIDAIYLIVIKVANNKALCFISAGDCLSVNSSVYSEIWGFPIAGLGAGAYLVILTMLVFEAKASWMARLAPFLLFGITLIGVIYSAYLTYLEIAVIKAICPFCVISAICMFFLFIISILNLIQTPLEN
jgi:uncharacterized membrane protein